MKTLKDHSLFGIYLTLCMLFCSFENLNNVQIEEVLIDRVETNFDFKFELLSIDASDSLNVIVDPSSFELPANVFSAYFRISLDQEDRYDSLAIYLDDVSIDNSFIMDITTPVAFREIQTYKLKVKNKGMDDLSDLDFSFRVDIVAGEFSGICPMLPNGVALLEYNLITSSGETQSKISYNFNTEEFPEDSTQQGNVMMTVYSYQMSKVLSESRFDLICTEDGAMLTGFEIGQLPPNQGNLIFIDMDIELNSNYIPNYPVVGTNLEDAEVKMVADAETTSYGDYPIAIQMEMLTTVNNRKVVALEEVTVPAGTFRAYRIEFNSDTEFEFYSDSLIGLALRVIKRSLQRYARSSTVVWYVRDLGFVKQETTTSEGTTRMELINLVR